MIIKVKEWKELEVETKKMQEKERLQDLAKVEGFLNQYTKSVDQCFLFLSVQISSHRLHDPISG